MSLHARRTGHRPRVGRDDRDQGGRVRVDVARVRGGSGRRVLQRRLPRRGGRQRAIGHEALAWRPLSGCCPSRGFADRAPQELFFFATADPEDGDGVLLGQRKSAFAIFLPGTRGATRKSAPIFPSSAARQRRLLSMAAGDRASPSGAVAAEPALKRLEIAPAPRLAAPRAGASAGRPRADARATRSLGAAAHRATPRRRRPSVHDAAGPASLDRMRLPVTGQRPPHSVC